MPSKPVTNQPERDVLAECQQRIGYTFQRPQLLLYALTHSSGANSRQCSNERLEFLGDSVLGLITCEQVFLRFPDFQEGEMTDVKSAVVSRAACARFSEQLGLGSFLIVGKGMQLRNDVPENMLADVFESLVAAIYLDAGLDVARTFLLQFIGPEIDRVVANLNGANAKSMLQQLGQKQFGTTPRYLLLDEQGPDHNKCFKVAAEMNRKCYPAAWGRNKKEAEVKAAVNALAFINGQEIPYPSD
ncbi:ribonuclease III [Tuwongella immobilis]|uniref:Ribonuclease 3 n=1 Tax=Tuwongella immobilis TaxID=692036 RepID=A0A6C2YRE7_9BACT|nr:ribonuclease III [Tuwongella immobilis]VIP03931.1 ribonuclease iii : Ribonuclease 3 OS=Pirellula staleyi (strain ATCC 27377 / DSM 6068 / ICPB 4128) GN=rnc PE=3 SV=1: Ribonucleas_3_3: dsrm [Tuwongella immobilis]VTS05229.1 ribonuclease iii : Ribonuclease 3 OS=Pirellula staleyi (strain ATCC 27377 / DSM 6068 / ICPB 4128) GN=rnc PE=3 SV=1: Ribonucleas_3_3: dsrm [Tuwongella immobilis]